MPIQLLASLENTGRAALHAFTPRHWPCENYPLAPKTRTDRLTKSAFQTRRPRDADAGSRCSAGLPARRADLRSASGRVDRLVGPTSGGRQRRMGFRRAPRAVQDRMKKMTERTHFPRAEEACRVDLGGRARCSPSRYRFVARQIRGLSFIAQRGWRHRVPLWRTLSACRVETLLDAWGSSATPSCSNSSNRRPHQPKMTKQTQFRTTSLQSMVYGTHVVYWRPALARARRKSFSLCRPTR